MTPRVTAVSPEVVQRLRWKVVGDEIEHGLIEPALHRQGRCSAPVAVMFSYQPGAMEAMLGKERAPATQVVLTRCRKCAECREERARMWFARAMREAEKAPRTWFCTLTFAPQNIPADCVTRDIDGDLKYRDEFAIREMQLWLKRLRKAGCRLRYFAMVERHKTGIPHLHVFLHDVAGSIRWRTLSGKWTAGFSRFKEVKGDGAAKAHAARYIIKYLFKAPWAVDRIPASRGYGEARTHKDGSPISGKDGSPISGSETRPSPCESTGREIVTGSKEYPCNE